MTIKLPPDATPEEWKNAVWKVWKIARTIDNTVPSHWLDAMRDLAIEAVRLNAAPTEPIDMVLHCPKCGMQHVDAPEDAECDGEVVQSAGWSNPPHRSHLCHGCGHIWRPADVPTNGVQEIKTKGNADSPVVTRLNAAPVPDGWREVFECAIEALEWHASRCCENSIPDATIEALGKLRAALAHPQQSAQGVPEPRWTSLKLAEMILSDCGHSTNYTPLLDRVAARIDKHVEEILAAHPQQSGAAQPPAQQGIEMTCRHCDGSGQAPYLSGGGPDAHDVTGLCATCKGSGVVAAHQQSGVDWSANLTRTAQGWQERAEKAEKSLKRVTRWAIAAGVPPEKIEQSGAAQPEQERKPMTVPAVAFRESRP